jgi:hypothetical protein
MATACRSSAWLAGFSAFSSTRARAARHKPRLPRSYPHDASVPPAAVSNATQANPRYTRDETLFMTARALAIRTVRAISRTDRVNWRLALSVIPCTSAPKLGGTSSTGSRAN